MSSSDRHRNAVKKMAERALTSVDQLIPGIYIRFVKFTPPDETEEWFEKARWTVPISMETVVDTKIQTAYVETFSDYYWVLVEAFDAT